MLINDLAGPTHGMNLCDKSNAREDFGMDVRLMMA